MQSQLGLLKSLTIRNAKLALLPNNFFAGLYIKRLALIDCAIRVVEPNAFNGLESMLQELRISDNALVEMPTKALSGMNALLKLDLSNNTIGELKAEHALPRMAKVCTTYENLFIYFSKKLLCYHYRHSYSFDIGILRLKCYVCYVLKFCWASKTERANLHFSAYFQLFDIDLSHNRIDNIHKSFFENAKNSLQTINLGHNNIVEVPASGK